MKIHVITIFPELITGFLRAATPKIACDKGALTVSAVNLRDFTTDFHRTVDDRPFGGGPGMVMLAKPILQAVEATEAPLCDDQETQAVRPHSPRRILLTPRGRPLDQRLLRELAQEQCLLILCGRYEGIDERVALCKEWDEVSLGDYVLSGGEVAAMVLIDGIARLLPGVLGHPDSAQLDSFENGLLEAPQYTRPRVFRGHPVPEELLSGDHAAIARWRQREAEKLTRERRPDLYEKKTDRAATTAPTPDGPEESC